MVHSLDRSKNTRTTIYDIARIASVSPSTVSRSLKNDTRIGLKTREKIQSIAEELGFRPSRVGKALATGRSQVIALVITDVSNPFFPEIIYGVEDKALEKDYYVSFWNTREDVERERRYLKMLEKGSFDGVILAASRVSQRDILNLVNRSIPCVVMNRVVKGIPSVVTDSQRGLYLATRHLIDEGYRRLAFFNGPGRAYASRQRKKGFLQATYEAELDENKVSVSHNPPTHEGGFRALMQLKGVLPEAIVTYDDLMAIGVMGACRKMGIKIPQDLALVGFDDISQASYSDPPLTTVRQPRYFMGQVAMNMLFDFLSGRRLSSETVFLQPELVIRESCGCVKNEKGDEGLCPEGSRRPGAGIRLYPGQRNS